MPLPLDHNAPHQCLFLIWCLGAHQFGTKFIFKSKIKKASLERHRRIYLYLTHSVNVLDKYSVISFIFLFEYRLLFYALLLICHCARGIKQLFTILYIQSLFEVDPKMCLNIQLDTLVLIHQILKQCQSL